MTSTIKVDTIQNAAGGVPSAEDLGLNISGTVRQIKQSSSVGTIVISSTSFVEVSTNFRITADVKADSILFYNVESNTETDSASFGYYTIEISNNGGTSWTQVQSSHVSGNSENFVVQNIGIYFANPFTSDGSITVRLLYRVGAGNQTFNDNGPGITGISSKATLIEFAQ